MSTDLMTERQVLLTLKGASVRFAHRPVMGPFDVKICEGDFIVVTGASGSGKTTLLRLCAGLLAPSSGEIIHSKDFSVGYVFQEPRLLPWYRVGKNIELPMTAQGVSAVEASRRASELLAEVGLLDSAHQWPLTLSGGMAQRVNLARALALRPRLLLLDEPFSSLDADTRGKMLALVVRHAKTDGMTIVCVTHYPEELAGVGATRLLSLAEVAGATSATSQPR